MLSESKTLDIYERIKKELNDSPFIILIGKYDQILGPRVLYTSIVWPDEDFVRILLRDALNTNNKYVILDFNKFYSQVCKIEIEDRSARGGKQLYAIILLRHVEHPLIPIIHFKQMEMIFHKIGIERILKDDEVGFKTFFEEINDIYIKKKNLLPLESVNLQIRSGVNTIQGFCELIVEEKRITGGISELNTVSYVEMMLDSCKEIMEALENKKSSI